MAQETDRLPTMPRLRNWFTTLHIPKTRAERIGVVILAAAVFSLLFALYGTPLFRVYLVKGNSMQPLLSSWSYCSLEKVSSDELLLNDVVMVKGETIGWSVKRITQILPNGLFLEGDNKDHSADSTLTQDGQKSVIVPFDELRGRITNVWTLKRVWRSRTPKGRWWNLTEFRYPPRATCVSSDTKYVAIRSNDKSFCIFDVKTGKSIEKIQGVPEKWDGSLLQFRRQVDGILRKFAYFPGEGTKDISTPESNRIIEKKIEVEEKTYTVMRSDFVLNLVGDNWIGVSGDVMPFYSPGDKIAFSDAEIDFVHHVVRAELCDGGPDRLYTKIYYNPPSNKFLALRNLLLLEN